jgi:hypothetical protein
MTDSSNPPLARYDAACRAIADGATRWSSMIEFAEGAKEARKQFQEKALEAIHAAAEAMA